MASETVIAHNVITSGRRPRHMGWIDEAYRDSANVFGKGVDAMHITGDLGLADFATIEKNDEGVPEAGRLPPHRLPGHQFITVGEKSYAVESATGSHGDIAVRLSSRRTDVTRYPTGCRNLCPWRWHQRTVALARGKNVPSYLTTPEQGPDACAAASSSTPTRITTTAPRPRSRPGCTPRRATGSSRATTLRQAGHLGGDTWVADAAIAMMDNENWSGMFVTLGGIDKAGHMWGAQADNAAGLHDPRRQTHVRCAAENADVQLGKMLDEVKNVDNAKGGETLVVLTADHGATYGEASTARRRPGASDSNWYYAPNGVYGRRRVRAFDQLPRHNDVQRPVTGPCAAAGRRTTSPSSTRANGCRGVAA